MSVSIHLCRIYRHPPRLCPDRSRAGSPLLRASYRGREISWCPSDDAGHLGAIVGSLRRRQRSLPVAPPRHQPRLQQGYRGEAHDKWRGSAASRGYDRAWRRCRDAFIAANPLCVFCLAKGELVAAREVDHIKTISTRPDLRLDWSNLRPLCKSCHSARTARDQRGT